MAKLSAIITQLLLNVDPTIKLYISMLISVLCIQYKKRIADCTNVIKIYLKYKNNIIVLLVHHNNPTTVVTFTPQLNSIFQSLSSVLCIRYKKKMLTVQML